MRSMLHFPFCMPHVDPTATLPNLYGMPHPGLWDLPNRPERYWWSGSLWRHMRLSIWKTSPFLVRWERHRILKSDIALATFGKCLQLRPAPLKCGLSTWDSTFRDVSKQEEKFQGLSLFGKEEAGRVYVVVNLGLRHHEDNHHKCLVWKIETCLWYLCSCV